MIDPYILAEKTFRGVFYKPPKEDKLITPKVRGGRSKGKGIAHNSGKHASQYRIS